MFLDFYEPESAHQEIRDKTNYVTNAILIAMLFILVWMWLSTG